jgi:uncharacterized protein YjiS (DUF1127 family)
MRSKITGSAGAKGSGLSDRFRRFVAFLQRAGEAARQRRALLRLDDSMLKDIGISRADAYREATRSWWDVPVAITADRRSSRSCRNKVRPRAYSSSESRPRRVA